MSKGLFGSNRALLMACWRYQRADYRMTHAQIPAEVAREIVTMLNSFDQQTGAMHAIEEVEQWLRDNQLKIVKEAECESLLPEPVEPSGDTS